MQRELPTKLYDGDAGEAGDGSNPGASARGRYAAKWHYSARLGFRAVQLGFQSSHWLGGSQHVFVGASVSMDSDLLAPDC